MSCPNENQVEVDQSTFWDSGKVNWSHHRIGWIISGAASVLTVIITMITVLQHCRNYHKPAEQRQIIRILYMPAVYATISFFSYRFFRHYTYYSLVEVAYEAVTLSAFMLLLIEYVAATAIDNTVTNAMARKDKMSLPIPFCCWRYRPTKAYFMYTIKWSVLQYVLIRPLVTIVGIICEAKDILCEAAGFDFHWANVYLEIVDFVSISIALYGLFLFYELTKAELAKRKPLAKFLAIKLIVMFTFYQAFMFKLLASEKVGVIKETKYWSATNIANGLNALTICLEMICFAIMMWWAYNAKEYRVEGRTTNIGKPLLDSINYADFGREIWGSLKFFFTSHNTPATHAPTDRTDFAHAFGVSTGYTKQGSSRGGSEGRSEYPLTNVSRTSYDESVRLAPYSYGPQDSTFALNGQSRM